MPYYMGNKMKKTFALAALVFSTGAFAAQTNTGCQGNCPTGDSITNQGGVGYGGNGGNATAGAVGVAIAGGGAGGSGGAGGAGGAGGSVVGSGNSSATGGAVVGSGNSTQGQQQGQNQGQSQVAKGGNANQAQSSRNDNRSSASNQNSNANSGNNAQTSVSVHGDTVSYQAARIPVATAYAPNIAPTALCKFGVSGGGQGMTFGFSVGVSITDDNCMLLEQVRTVSVILGQKEVAQEMMMAVPAYAEAVARMKGVKSTAGSDVKSVSTQAKVEYNDPIIRSRLGLPPLK